MNKLSPDRFDFITDPEFRNLIWSDYEEAFSANAASLPKACLVISGSILEALLLIWLLPPRQDASYEDSYKALTKLALHDLILQVKDKKPANEEIHNLSLLLKEYRNLIHPGRAIRLKEKATPDRAQLSITVIHFLVDFLEHTIPVDRTPTAERLWNSIQRSPENSTAHRSLIQHLPEEELKSFILNYVLPFCTKGINPFDHDDYVLERTIKSCCALIISRFAKDSSTEVLGILYEYLHDSSMESVSLVWDYIMNASLIFSGDLKQQQFLIEQSYTVNASLIYDRLSQSKSYVPLIGPHLDLLADLIINNTDNVDYWIYTVRLLELARKNAEIYSDADRVIDKLLISTEKRYLSAHSQFLQDFSWQSFKNNIALEYDPFAD